MKERNLIALKLVVSHLMVLPLLICLGIILNYYGVLIFDIAQTVFLILVFAGYWEFFGSKFKWTYLSILELGIVGALVFNILMAVPESLHTFGSLILGFILLFLLIVLTKILLVIFENPKEKMELIFPFKKGSYLISDGGNSKISRLMNYHFHSPTHKKKGTHHSMLYATDIVKINPSFKAFLPAVNSNYAIFNQTVYSPMAGKIVKVIDSINDNEPFVGHYPYNTGNTIVIKKDNYYLLLGHLKKSSILVSEGDEVSCDDVLANVGNSGFSERPHLHMQLIKSDTPDYWKGQGICLQYQRKNLYKNRMITVA